MEVQRRLRMQTCRSSTLQHFAFRHGRFDFDGHIDTSKSVGQRFDGLPGAILWFLQNQIQTQIQQAFVSPHAYIEYYSYDLRMMITWQQQVPPWTWASTNDVLTTVRRHFMRPLVTKPGHVVIRGSMGRSLIFDVSSVPSSIFYFEAEVPRIVSTSFIGNRYQEVPLPFGRHRTCYSPIPPILFWAS